MYAPRVNVTNPRGRTIEAKGLGWIPDVPDVRDLTPASVGAAWLRTTRRGKRRAPSVDLRKWMPPIEDQGSLGSCTAHCAIAAVEYFERRAAGKHLDASRLFLYKVTRNLLGWRGDTGGYIRSTMKALVCFGVPPEAFWPYEPARLDEEPTAFVYGLARNFRPMKYYRLDARGVSPSELLASVRRCLSSGFPLMFGFPVYPSVVQARSAGDIPVPDAAEPVQGGHAVTAAGYDDGRRIRNWAPGSQESVGAILIRNSWGPNWGDGGYGWLPYDFVLRGLAIDWWTMTSAQWVDSSQFE